MAAYDFHRAGSGGGKTTAILRERVDEFARPVTLEMGKLIDQARGEVVLSASIIDYYAKNAERFLAPQRLEPSSGEAVAFASNRREWTYIERMDPPATGIGA